MTKKEREEIANSFEEAAGKLASYKEDSCCNAIKNDLALKIFTDLYFKDSDGAKIWSSPVGVPWWLHEYFMEYYKLRNYRIFALLLAAQIVRTGDLPEHKEAAS